MASKSDWLDSNANELRRFLSQATGQKLMDICRRAIPVIDADKFESAALQGREKQGAENVLQLIRDLTEPATKPDSTGLDNVDIANEPD